MIRRALLFLAWTVVTTTDCLADETLSELYPATRTWSSQGLMTTSTADDVWRVSSFTLLHLESLDLRCGESTVVLGRNGTDVLWAVVLPDAPPPIKGDLALDHEFAKSILLRFAPSAIDTIFPPDTVLKRGEGLRRYEALHIASRKMVWKWCTPSGNSTIVPPSVTIVDIDTVEGPRRFWALDRDSKQIARIEDFVDQPTPPLQSIDVGDALAAFNHVWSAFDTEYAKFVDLPAVDWKAIGENYRAELKTVDTTLMLGAILAEMLAHLEDLHINVRVGDQWIPGYMRERPINGNWIATQARLSESERLGNDLVWGRTNNNIGYLGVHGLGDQNLPEHVDAALEKLRGTDAMIVDLRFNGGGDELLGRAIAGRFAEQTVIYSNNQYRNGPEHDDLGPILDRVLEPRGPWRYEKPVVCLFGAHTLSSAESLAAMFDVLPNVTTMGSPTGGSSGNPRRIELDCGIMITLPRWRDLLVDGTPIERHGVAPDVLIEFEAQQFTEKSDPVFVAALDAARKRMQLNTNEK